LLFAKRDKEKARNPPVIADFVLSMCSP